MTPHEQRLKFMKQASDLAFENTSSQKGGPFGCVIVHKDQVIATGVNQVVHHTDPTAHAEIQALREACRVRKSHHLVDCEVYSSCEPCSMCFSALRWAGISTIYFDKTRDDAASIGFRDDDIYLQIIERKQDLIHLSLVPNEKDAFVHWANTENKVPY